MTANLSARARGQAAWARRPATQSGGAGRAERVIKLVAQAPTSTQGILKRALEGTGGRKNAITAMCMVCTGYERETVRNCTGWSCPLWTWRPFQSRAETALKLGTVEGGPEEKRAASVSRTGHPSARRADRGAT